RRPHPDLRSRSTRTTRDRPASSFRCRCRATDRTRASSSSASFSRAPFNPEMDLAGKVALITGGKRIGIAVAEALAGKGADVALSYMRSRTEAEDGAARVSAAGRRSGVFQADVSDPAACDALISAVVEKLGRLDVLVNMASVYSARPFDQLTSKD